MNTWWKKKRRNVIKEAKTMDHEPKFKVGETVGYREESERIGCYKLGIIQDIRQREKESLKTACDLTYLTYDTVTEYYVVRNGFRGMPGVWFEACDLCKLSIKIEEENKMPINFTKNMLEIGMLVVTRDGNRYIVMRNANGEKDFVSVGKVLSFNCFFNDLTRGVGGDSKDDIVRVYGLQKINQIIPDILATETKIKMACGGEYPNRDLLWTRGEVKEMTVEEISKALGYEVKIVK